MELRYTPADGDCFVYLLGPVAKGSRDWQVCPGTYGQGFLSLEAGREVVDYAVQTILDTEQIDSGVRGDAYYVVVQAASSVSRFRLSGYFPRALTGSSDTTSDATHTRAKFRRPASARRSIKIAGAPYGGPFDIRPSSQGRVECRLEYPADVDTRMVATATRLLVAAYEQYVYPPLWEPADDGSIPVRQSIAYSHWDLYDLNRHAAAPLGGSDWYGLQGAFDVQADGPWNPNRTYHYVPVLWLAAGWPYSTAPAQPGPPATGRRTVGYKATILIPQNLRFASASKRVRRGRRAILRGSLAIPADGTFGAAVAWAPVGTSVQIQKRVRGRWIFAKNATIRADGSWRASVRVRRTTRWRAYLARRRGRRRRVLCGQANCRSPLSLILV